jgi:hypothetical protein
MPKYQKIDLGFSTADGARPELHFIGGDIRFSFVDWRERLVSFLASDVRAFSWVEELDDPELRDDAVYEVLESDLIRKSRTLSVTSPEVGYRHYKLCFNAVGALDIVCQQIAIVPTP